MVLGENLHCRANIEFENVYTMNIRTPVSLKYKDLVDFGDVPRVSWVNGTFGVPTLDDRKIVHRAVSLKTIMK